MDVVTFGQYLRPTEKHLSVVEYVHPDVFEELREEALERDRVISAQARPVLTVEQPLWDPNHVPSVD